MESVGDSLEAAKVLAFFKNKKWPEITLESLVNEYQGDISACLEFLPPEAGLYYLPAYLIICVDSPVAADVLPDTLIRQLNQEPKNSKNFVSLISTLNLQQKNSIAKVLEFLATVDWSEQTASAAHRVLMDKWINYLN
jgi:hypothetical protein